MARKSNISLVASSILALSCLTPQVSAFWRLPCHNPVSMERADPIVDAGKVAGHLHTIMGGNGFDFAMDYSDARNSTCSSCTVTSDFSNYWIPSLFYQAQNGSFTPVRQNGGALVYYLQRRGSDDEKLFAFPEGFRMLAGDSMLRSYTDVAEQKAISYACIDYNGGGGPETPGFPQRNCANGWRLQVFFPSCWDGENLDSEDHKSHMAYPDGVTGGKCPSTHPVRFISIFYEVLYEVNDFSDQWYDSKPPFVLSNGDPTGYGLHGDFVNGWDVPLLQKAVDECNNLSGNVEDCPHFTYFPDDKVKDCFVPPRVDEVIDGWMDALPGCNPVQAGPGRAVKSTDCDATTVIGPAKTYSTDVSSRGWSYVDCVKDDLNSRTFPIRTGDDAMTVEMCIDYCISKGNSYAGVEYGTECYCGNSAPAADRLGARCTMPCAGDTNEICGDGQRLSVYKKSDSPAVSVSTRPSSMPAASSSTKSSTSTITSSSTVLSSTAVSVTIRATSIPKITASTRAPTSTTASTRAPTSTTTSTRTPTSTTSPSSIPAGWVSKGCWVDPVNPRALDTVGYWGEKITTSGCIKHCNTKGFKYAGAEYSGQCFCSNNLVGGKSAPGSECNMPCEGNSNETCGGSARLSLFQKTGNTKRSFRSSHRNYNI